MRDLILRLARPMARLLGRDDRGAVGVLVSVLIGGGVLLGMGALVLDVGTLYQERAELQNGADAAAFASANHCATGDCVLPDLLGASKAVANSNASSLTGHVQKVNQVCGYASGSASALTACDPASTGSLADCPPNPASPTANYVDVQTSTQMPDGSTLLPPVLGRTILGNGAYQGTDVGACAQAQWGPASQSESLALTISLCVWQTLTGDTDYTTDPNESAASDASSDTMPDTDDSDFSTDPNEGTASDSAGDTAADNDAFKTPVAIYIKGKAKPCGGPAGSNLSGGFDWLSTDTDTDGENSGDTDSDNDASNTCTASINLNTSTSYNNTGNNVSAACKTALANDVASYLAGHPVTVYLPVFKATSGTGRYASYTIAGLAGFVITGYANLPGMTDAGENTVCGTSTSTSGANAPCIQGYFIPGLDPVGTIGQFGDFGAVAVQLTG